MASKTFYFLSTKFSGVEHLELQDGGVAPATATSSTGWIVGLTLPAQYSLMNSTVEQSADTFQTTEEPSFPPNNTFGDCFVAGPYTGEFAAGNWTFAFPVIAVTSGGGADGRVRFRLWRSSSSSGASATEITRNILKGSLITDLATGAAQTSSLTVDPGIIVLAGEYLFIQVAWEITGLALLITDDVLLRIGSASAITTTNFTSGETLVANTDKMVMGGSATITDVILFGGRGSLVIGGSATITVGFVTHGWVSRVPHTKVIVSGSGDSNIVSRPEKVLVSDG